MATVPRKFFSPSFTLQFSGYTGTANDFSLQAGVTDLPKMQRETKLNRYSTSLCRREAVHALHLHLNNIFSPVSHNILLWQPREERSTELLMTQMELAGQLLRGQPLGFSIRRTEGTKWESTEVLSGPTRLLPAWLVRQSR